MEESAFIIRAFRVFHGKPSFQKNGTTLLANPAPKGAGVLAMPPYYRFGTLRHFFYKTEIEAAAGVAAVYSHHYLSRFPKKMPRTMR